MLTLWSKFFFLRVDHYLEGLYSPERQTGSLEDVSIHFNEECLDWSGLLLWIMDMLIMIFIGPVLNAGKCTKSFW